MKTMLVGLMEWHNFGVGLHWLALAAIAVLLLDKTRRLPRLLKSGTTHPPAPIPAVVLQPDRPQT
jgi:hypothetical protein